jgi:hypothetical protein
VRFVWAVVAFVLAALMIGAGIAQRTIFPASEAQSIPIETAGDTAFTLIDGAVLTSLPGSQTLTVEGEDEVFAAYGRTSDVTAWLSDASYTAVTLGADNTVQTSDIEPEAAAAPTPEPTPASTATPSETPAAETDTPATTTEGRSPVGSDLWLDEFEQQGRLTTPLQLPDTMSVLVASDGTAPAPTRLTLTWPVDSSTPWAGPLIIGGAIVLAVGLFLYVLGIRHARRARGPRRKGLPLPQTEPIDLAIEGADKGVISSGAPTRRGLASGRRRLIAVPALVAVGLVASGCSADIWPQFEASASPSPSASVVAPEGQQTPAVTEAQAERILTRISQTVADADAGLDPALAATRLAGTALAERETNYTLRTALPDQAALAAIPDEPVEIILPQAFDEWPRSFLSVVEGAAGSSVAPTIMVVTQSDPWSDYKVEYIASLEAATNLPDLAAPYVGAPLVPPESAFLTLSPAALPAAYADVIDNGENSASWNLFDTANDQLLSSIRADRQARLDELARTGRDTASLTYQSAPGTQAPMAISTLDGGAIVAIEVRETETAKPTNEDAVIRLNGDTPNVVVQALTGVDQSATGFTTSFVDQVFFYVPSKAENAPIRVLGYRSNILESKVIE